MRVAVLGAGGKLGQRCLESCLRKGYEVTAAVRRPDRLQCLFEGLSIGSLRLTEFDAANSATIDAALDGQDAVICAAGNVADGADFVALFDAVVSAAERVLRDRHRVWMLAGAMILDIPHAARIGIGLPFVPARYQPHLANWHRLERSTLDWALMCPGPMVPIDGPYDPEAIQLSTDTLPYAVGRLARLAPPVALSMVLQRNLPRIKVPYRCVADLMADHLEPGGRFSRHRVGVGWRTVHAARNMEGTVQ